MSAPPQNQALGSKHRLLLRVERFSRRNYLLIFVLALAALAGGAFLGSKLELESNILALIPEGNPRVDSLREALEDFGSIDYLLVLLQAEEGKGPDELEEFADLFAENLEERDDLIDVVEYRFEHDEAFLELFYENALLFLDADGLDEIAGQLEDEAILEQLRQNKLIMTSPTGALMADQVRNDPLGLMPLFINRLAGNQGVFKIDLSGGYYLGKDGRSLIMLVKPTGPSQDLAFDKLLLAGVSEAEAATREELRDDMGYVAGDEVGVGARYGGTYAVAVDEERLIRKDVTFNAFASLFAVSALYFLCYRRFAALFYSSLPLLVGQALTFGLAFLVLRGLNASSSAFAALLMGLGTDFVIVIYARYVEERQKGRTLAEATELMIGETGLGVFTGAITSAGTFYAMCISQFRGLFDLGFLIGSGILLCAIAILFMLPAMIKWNEGVRRRKSDVVKKLHLQSFLLEHLITFSARHRGLVLTAAALITAASVYGATQVEFDDTSKVLRSDRSDAFRVQSEIAETFGASLSYMMAIAEAPTRDEAMELTQRVAKRLHPYIEDGTVGSMDSILTYLPASTEQAHVLRTLSEDAEGRFDGERIRATFLRGLNETGFRHEAYAEFLERMQRFLAPARPVTLDDLEQQGLDRLLQRYVNTDGGRVRIVTYLHLTDPAWKRRSPPGMIDALTAGDEGIVVTGTNVANVEFRRIFMRESKQSLAIGLVFVLALLWIDFRSLKLTAVALTQLLCGVAIMLGTMKVLGIHLNYVNAFVATMILGVGIDYSIHLVHRLSLNGGRVDAGVLETGKAVVIAALTNIAAFYTLTLGNYPALRSFGTVALLGSACCLLTSLTLVPALMGRADAQPGSDERRS
ncbi:MAG: MMPL family transporter [bacterium]|nr:MMPL family transporter [bacterium]